MGDKPTIYLYVQGVVTVDQMKEILSIADGFSDLEKLNEVIKNGNGVFLFLPEPDDGLGGTAFIEQFVSEGSHGTYRIALNYHHCDDSIEWIECCVGLVKPNIVFTTKKGD